MALPPGRVPTLHISGNDPMPGKPFFRNVMHFLEKAIETFPKNTSHPIVMKQCTDSLNMHENNVLYNVSFVSNDIEKNFIITQSTYGQVMAGFCAIQINIRSIKIWLTDDYHAGLKHTDKIMVHDLYTYLVSMFEKKD
jgi:hypothetical protein